MSWPPWGSFGLRCLLWPEPQEVYSVTAGCSAGCFSAVARFALRSNQFGQTRNAMNELAIHHDVAGHQFEATVEGHHAYLAYMDLGQQTLDIYRTYVPNALRGQGIAAALTEHALQYAERMGYSVIPSCSYVERYMERRERRAGKQ